jgi:hypothetical protein
MGMHLIGGWPDCGQPSVEKALFLNRGVRLAGKNVMILLIARTESILGR